MKRWLISYVLYSPGVEHVDFVNALRHEGAARILPFHWLLESGKEAAELQNQFEALLHPNDQLLIAELGEQVVWRKKE